MHQGLPSITAIVVAAARALSSTTTAAECDPGDESALALLPRSVRRTLHATSRAARVVPWLPRAIALSSFGLVDHLALRARAIDRALEDAIDDGLDQVVILGAGLDTRAHRLAALAAARVFEVDHPDSQAHKRARAGSLSLKAGTLEYVPVDFARDALGEALRVHGHDAKQPTFWIWEGVVPYLEREAIRGTLQAVAERSARGSRLATTYATPELVWMRRASTLIGTTMSAIGEPVRSLIEPAEWKVLLQEVGFDLASDTDTRAWRELYAERKRFGIHVTYERLAIGVR